jgi:hypothetical protein
MQTTPYIKATWHGMEWYSYATFFMVAGFYLSFVVPLTGSVPFVDIPPSTAVVMGVACWLVVILQRMEALLEQISHINFSEVCRRPIMVENGQEADVEVRNL